MSFATRQVGGMSHAEQLTLDDNYKELRRRIWLATDTEYKHAVEMFTAKQSALQNQSHGDDIPDFSREKPNQFFEPSKAAPVDVAALENAARQISAVFRQMPEIETSDVVVSVNSSYARYLSTEGTEYAAFDPGMSVHLQVTAQAADGLPISDNEEIYLGSPRNLVVADVIARAQQVVTRLQKLRTSPTLDRYNGPVLFEGDAGAEVFAQLFAPALIALRNPVTDEPRAQAFLDQMNTRFGSGSLIDRIGGRVLPDYVSLVDNPTIDTFQGKRLTGKYDVDEEGLPVRTNTLVEGGVLKMVLNSRTPATGSLQSTASRFGISAAPTNLFFNATKTTSQQELRRMLLASAKARGLEYGVIVRRAGGTANEFIQAAMLMAQGGGPSGNNMLEVVKLYQDGHEELVHGTQLQSITSASFKDIVAVGDQPVVYSTAFLPGFSSLMMVGLSGEASAVTGLPVVTYVVPSLLFDDATLKKAAGPFPKPPVTAPPPLSLK
jgi:hypothetical protein